MATLVVGACGGSPEGARKADPARSRDPCALLTPADVQEVTGQQANAQLFSGSIPPFDVVGMSLCEYGSDKATATVFVGVTPPGVSSSFARAALSDYISRSGQPGTPEPGLGDEAVSAKGGLLVISHNRILAISVVPKGAQVDNTGLDELRRRLAKKILQRDFEAVNVRTKGSGQ